jgi:hypothetical protein
MSDQHGSLPDLLPGLTFEPLPDGWTPMEAFVLVKCLDDDGEPSWSQRVSAGINEEELLGALIVQTDLWKQALIRDWDAD